MAKGNSILIHAGSGGIGMAAIRIALSLKATIFTTVGSQKKKEFLLKTFPDLEEGNIGKKSCKCINFGIFSIVKQS